MMAGPAFCGSTFNTVYRKVHAWLGDLMGGARIHETNNAVRMGNSAARQNRMGTDPVGKLLLRFALPVVTGMLITRLYVLVDGMFVGQAVGTVGIAATTMAMPFVTLLSALVMLIGDGGTAVMALRLGEKRLDEAPRVLGNALFMLIAAAVVLALIVPWILDPLLEALGATGEVLEQARIYLLITVFGTFSLGFSLGIDTFLRAMGFPNRTLLVQVAGALANIALDYLFVIVFGWGVAGAAWATVLGQLVAMGITVAFLFSRDMPFRLKLSDCRPSLSLVGRITVLGMPSFIVRGSDALLNIVLNVLIVGYGATTLIGSDDALAVAGAASRVTQFVMVVAIGIAVGARPLFGFNYGAGNHERVIALAKQAILSGTVCLSAIWLFIELWPGALMGLFGFEAQTQEFAEWVLRVTLFALPILMIRVTGTNFFQGTGQATKAIVLTFVQQIVLLLPFMLAAPFTLPPLFGCGELESVFIATLAADVASTALVGMFLARGIARMKK